MTREVVTVPPSAQLTEAVLLMLDLEIDGLPVVDDDKLVGIVTTADVLHWFCRVAECSGKDSEV